MNISLLQWNIWYGEDIRNVAAFLRDHKTDIICLQELTLGHPRQPEKDTPAYLGECLNYDYYYKDLVLSATDGEKIYWADGIFSRFPIVNKRHIWTNQPQKGGGYDDEYRVYVEVTVDVEGKHLVVGTTHMAYTHRFESTPVKSGKPTYWLRSCLSTKNDLFLRAT